jgi:hypothetical protein
MEKDLYEMLSAHFQSIAGNIEEYVRDFLRIYRESDREANAQKQINELRTQLTREKAKREKLLDLYTEGDISRDEFRERNGNSNVLIAQLEEDIFQLETKASQTADYAAEMQKIEEYFRTLYRPGHIMSKEEVDEMAKTMIDRIDVVPVNRTEMKLEIKLKTSASADISYIRSGDRYGRRSGHITKKMIDAYKMQ